MKYLKLFENFREIKIDEYNKIDKPEELNKRELDLVKKFADINEWDLFYLTRDSDIQLEFYKRNGDYFYRISIDKQYDEYYLVSVDFEDFGSPNKDSSRYFILDTYEELNEFLLKIEKFYKHKRLFSTQSIIQPPKWII